MEVKIIIEIQPIKNGTLVRIGSIQSIINKTDDIFRPQETFCKNKKEIKQVINKYLDKLPEEFKLMK